MAAKKQNFVTYLTIVNFLIAIILTGLVVYVFQTLKKDIDQKATPIVSHVVYSCDGNKNVSSLFYDGKAQLTLSDNRNLLLLQTISASGVRYTNTDNSIVFWTKGNTAFIQEGENLTYSNCVEKERD